MNRPRLTFSTGSLYLYGLDRVFALAAENGVDGIEVLCDQRLDSRQPENLRRLMDTYGLPVLSLHSPFVGKGLPGWNHGRDNVGIIKHTVALAEEIGAEHVVVHLPHKVGMFTISHRDKMWLLPWRNTESDVHNWMASGAMARFQAETPVKICVENLPKFPRKASRIKDSWLTWWNTLEEWPRVHPYLTLDTTHWATHGIKPLDAYRAGGERIRHIHLSNYRNGQEHQLPHNGELDLTGFLQALVADDFDGHVVLELNPKSLEAVDSEKARQNLSESVIFCRDVLTQ